MFVLVEITCFTEVVFNDGKAFRLPLIHQTCLDIHSATVVPLTVFQRTF
jgi:hypothetical protein